MTGTEGWPRFAELARELDRVRGEESAVASGVRGAVAQMSQNADELEARLNGQRAMLTNLAKELRVRPPSFTPSLPAGEVDPATSLATVSAAIDRGDTAARQASQRGEYAGILPGLSVVARSVVVYGIAAALIVAVQWINLVSTRGPGATPGAQAATAGGPSFVTVMILIPAIGFRIAYAVLSFGARTRIPGAARQRPRTRLGFLMCFGVGPVVLLIFFALDLQQKLSG